MSRPFTYTLQIQYKTAFGTITDPRLHNTLQHCHTIIGERQRDFSTTFEVTVTDTVTGEVLLQVTYLKDNLNLDLEDFFDNLRETPPA
jgi:hypothetical protein